jgi:non-specific protein-tyrosine kinase
VEGSHRELRAIWAYRWWLLVFVVAASAGAYVASKRQAPTYEAHALVQIVPGSTQHGQLLTADQIQSVANTYLEIVRTDPVYRRTAALLTTRSSAVSSRDVSSHTDAQAQQNVTVLELFGKAHSAAAAARTANAYATGFAGYVAESQASQVAQAETPIKADIAAQEAALATLPANDPRRAGANAELQADLNQVATLGPGTADVARILESALPPDLPASPRPKLNALLALIAALVIGTAALYGYILLSDRYRSAEEVAVDLGLPILAEIPRAPMRDQRSLEAFRRLRTSLVFALREPRSRLDENGFGASVASPSNSPRGGKSALRNVSKWNAEPTEPSSAAVVITGARRGDGKTFVAANLARSLAAAGWRTAAVDADLRHPTLHSELGIVGLPGLTDALTRPTPGVGPLIQEVRPPRLGAGRPQLLAGIGAGTPVADATERLSSQEMALAIDSLRKQFDVVVFDSAPLEPVVDTVVLSRWTQGVLVVVDVRRSRRGAARRAVEILRASDAPLLGIVLNRTRANSRRRSGQYGGAVAEEYDMAATAG